MFNNNSGECFSRSKNSLKCSFEIISFLPKHCLRNVSKYPFLFVNASNDVTLKNDLPSISGIFGTSFDKF